VTESDDIKLTITVEEAGELLGVSRGAAYGAANRGEIPVIRIGRRLLVPKKTFERMFDHLLVADRRAG
jgi:excisionase family DNA binding protein